MNAELTRGVYGKIPVVRATDPDVQVIDTVFRTAEIRGVWYYLTECPAGLGTLACRTAWGADYGGNVIHKPRTAPADLGGIAAPLRGLPVRTMYSDPEYWVD